MPVNADGEMLDLLDVRGSTDASSADATNEFFEFFDANLFPLCGAVSPNQNQQIDQHLMNMTASLLHAK